MVDPRVIHVMLTEEEVRLLYYKSIKLYSIIGTALYILLKYFQLKINIFKQNYFLTFSLSLAG